MRAAFGVIDVAFEVLLLFSSFWVTAASAESAKSVGGGRIICSFVGSDGGNISEMFCASIGGVHSFGLRFLSFGVVVPISTAGMSSSGFSGSSHCAAHIEVGERRPEEGGAGAEADVGAARTMFNDGVEISGALIALAAFGVEVEVESPPSAPAGIGIARPCLMTPRMVRAVLWIGAVLSPAEECRLPSFARVRCSISVRWGASTLGRVASAAPVHVDESIFVCVNS